MANSPIIAGDKVILLADLVKDSHIAAYDLADGHQVWKVGRLDGVTGGFSTPGVITDAQGAQSIITVGAEGLLAYKTETGEQRVLCARRLQCAGHRPGDPRHLRVSLRTGRRN